MHGDDSEELLPCAVCVQRLGNVMILQLIPLIALCCVLQRNRKPSHPSRHVVRAVTNTPAYTHKHSPYFPHCTFFLQTHTFPPPLSQHTWESREKTRMMRRRRREKKRASAHTISVGRHKNTSSPSTPPPSCPCVAYTIVSTFATQEKESDMGDACLDTCVFRGAF
ncbi:unnamed protein product [Trypanosoma congolense IL3000]|uniref:WGS project CAEQ00000000 data, annotated contig 1373 n=1 Tax=Trypanosoma congolense (strain IL3000) TaxID=1068625 RepID=F9W5T2_TRYCI|nr:unnamed protein product [Trypanosoma congolense IL3000]